MNEQKLQDLEELMRQALYESAIEVECPECSGLIRCEPDADSSYCYGCEKVVHNINPLIKEGYM